LSEGAHEVSGWLAHRTGQAGTLPTIKNRVKIIRMNRAMDSGLRRAGGRCSDAVMNGGWNENASGDGLAPELAVEGAEADGFGGVIGGDAIGAFQVGRTRRMIP
jgi:hypothetical protein